MAGFPQFKALELSDKDFIGEKLRAYQPETSELTFTNLFIWRGHYGFQWSVYDRWLLVIGANSENGVQALPPIGPPSRGDITRMLLEWMRDEKKIADPRIDRADNRLISELEGMPELISEPVRDHYDYVYRTEDLIQLTGKSYRAKRNHLNYLNRTYRIVYEPMRESHLEACLGLAGTWCDVRRCKEDLNLVGEWDAIREALGNFGSLELDGAVILIDGRVEAFTLGELLNPDTAVVHIEKANTEIRGLYTVVNQQFCEKRWKDVPFINREQDLGEPGLRTAKLSYNPERLVEKYRIRLRS
jgi:uncharacterized protein